MVNIFLNIVLVFLMVFFILVTLGLISIPVCFIGYIIEETKDNDEGFFHKMVETIFW